MVTRHWSKLYKKFLEKSLKFRALQFDQYKAIVKPYNESFGEIGDHIVDLQLLTCTCLKFQDFKIPCEHGLCFIRTLGKEWMDFVDKIYFISSYQTLSNTSIIPVRISTLKLSDNIAPPSFAKKIGRPKKREC